MMITANRAMTTMTAMSSIMVKPEEDLRRILSLRQRVMEAPLFSREN